MAVVIGIVLLITALSNPQGHEKELLKDTPANSLALANQEDVIVNIWWSGPQAQPPNEPRTTFFGKDGYYYNIDVKNLKLKYKGSVLPLYNIHPILTIQGHEVDITGMSSLPPNAIKNGIFEFPNFRVERIWSNRKPMSQDVYAGAAGKAMIYNKQYAVLSFWMETACFTENYIVNKNPQVPEMLRLCCPSTDKCDWLGAVNLESTNRIYESAGIVLGKIIYTGNTEFTDDTEYGKTMVFEIQNTGDFRWEKGGSIEADDNVVVAIYGCLEKDSSGQTVPVMKRYTLSDFFGGGLEAGGNIKSTVLGNIYCKLPQFKENVGIMLFANCQSSGTIPADTSKPPCSNAGALVVDSIQPFIT